MALSSPSNWFLGGRKPLSGKLLEYFVDFSLVANTLGNMFIFPMLLNSINVREVSRDKVSLEFPGFSEVVKSCVLIIITLKTSRMNWIRAPFVGGGGGGGGGKEEP